MIGIDIVEMAGEFCDKDFLFVMHSKQVLEGCRQYGFRSDSFGKTYRVREPPQSSGRSLFSLDNC